jgi:hypothetical protein
MLQIKWNSLSDLPSTDERKGKESDIDCWITRAKTAID